MTNEGINVRETPGNARLSLSPRDLLAFTAATVAAPNFCPDQEIGIDPIRSAEVRGARSRSRAGSAKRWLAPDALPTERVSHAQRRLLGTQTSSAGSVGAGRFSCPKNGFFSAHRWEGNGQKSQKSGHSAQKIQRKMQ